MRRVSVITTASGNGGTTFSRELAARLGVPFHELALLAGAGPESASANFGRAKSLKASASRPRRAPVEAVATDGWVIDGSYQSKLGDFVFRDADVVVWPDQPMRVWSLASCGAPLLA